MLFCENNINGTNLPLMCLIKNTLWVLSVPHNDFLHNNINGLFHRNGIYKKTICGI